MTQMTPPALPDVRSATLAVTLSLGAAENKLQLPSGFTGLLSAALGRTGRDLDVLYDYAHDEQIGATGQYWKGRKPTSGDLKDVLPQLVQDDQLGPAMTREVDAQFAKDPEWDAHLKGEVLDKGHEIVTALTAWDVDADLTPAAKDAAAARWWAGRMVGRVYVPDEYGEVLLKNPPRDLAAALEFVHVEAIDPRHGGPVVNGHGRTLGYWNRYTLTEGTEKVTHIEVYTPERSFRLRQGSGGAATLVEDSVADNPLASAGTRRRPEFLMWHADRDGGSALTRTVRDLQDRLNVVTTYMGRNDEQTGYRQFIVANAQEPRTPEGKPAAYQMGPGVVVNLKGLTIDAVTYQEGDSPKRHTPTWQVVDPLNPAEYHIPAITQWTRRILDKLDQTFTLVPETQVSGESKRQSRKPFDRRVTIASQDTGAFLAWALRAALMLAAQLLGREREYQDVTFVPRLFLDVDAINLEETRVKLAMWQAGALQLEALLQSTPGIADAAAAAKAIEEDGTGNPDQAAKQAALDRLVNGSGGGSSGNV